MTFSIITVTYNAAATLGRTLQSVAAQTHADIEHIVVDGASADGTVAMAEAYKARVAYPVVVVSEKDNGLYDAMNKAMSLATGDYVVFLNAGDKLHDSSTLERVALAAEGSPAIIYGDTAIVDNQGTCLHLRRLRPPKRLTWRSFRHGMLVCHQSFYVRRDIAQRYDLRWRFSADFDWCIRCMKEGKRRGLANVPIVAEHSVTSASVAGFSPAVLTDYLAEGMTTANHRASLKERMCIMARHYGWPVTVAMHLWFIARAIIK